MAKHGIKWIRDVINGNRKSLHDQQPAMHEGPTASCNTAIPRPALTSKPYSGNNDANRRAQVKISSVIARDKSAWCTRDFHAMLFAARERGW
jgi:hypothetical protein